LNVAPIKGAPAGVTLSSLGCQPQAAGGTELPGKPPFPHHAASGPTSKTVRLYLALPPAQWLFGKQMLVVARKA
jgi:hypothetical protein